MTETSTDNGVEPPTGDGEQTATKETTATSAEEATVEESASDVAPQTPNEASPEEEEKSDDKKEEEKEDGGDQTDATEADSEKKEEKDVEERKGTETKASPPAEPTTETDKNGKDGDKKDAEKAKEEKPDKQENQSLASGPVVSATKRTRPAYKYDPDKITLRFLFANKDGLTVTVECKPSDTVGEVKGQLLSVWPEDLPPCSGGDQLRLICMGKGMLMPDTRTLEDCQVPVFKTHPTPVNVSVRPKPVKGETTKSGKDFGSRGSSSPGVSMGRTTDEAGTGCGCVIQ